MHDFDLIAIGSGPAGQRAAIQTAKLGKRAAIVEKGRVLGGVCVGTGTIPSKTFREAALSFMQQGDSGLRPAASELLSRVKGVMEREFGVIRNQLQRNGVTVFEGEASFVDPHRISISSETGVREITADNIVVAVGTRAARPPDVEVDGERILLCDDVIRMAELPGSMTVVGGGVIGIEYASMFAALGVEVTLIERRERPLEFLDREIVDELIHQMRNQNRVIRAARIRRRRANLLRAGYGLVGILNL